MEFPRRVVPGQVWFVTRRCLEGRFLLRPDPEMSRIVLYAFALAAQRTNVRVIAMVQMSNHLHLLVQDMDARLGEFLQIAHFLIARAGNSLRKRRDCFFDARPPCCVPVETMEDVVRIMAYIEANPVRAGLVHRAKDWPGVSTVELEFGEEITVPRPEVYFAPNSEEPELVSLMLSSPPSFGSGLSGKQIRQMVRRRVREAERAAVGSTVLGAKKVLAQDPNGRPEEPPAQRRVVLSCNPEVAKRIRERDDAFREAYAAARKKWILDKRTLLPFGTYWLRVFAGAHCESAPAEEWFA